VKPLGDPPFTCLITEGRASSENFETQSSVIVEIARAASADGVDLIQIREKSLDARSLFELTRSVVRALDDAGTLVLVNDRADIAAAAAADGVHLPRLGLEPDVVRRIFPRLLIGVSTHSREAASSAVENGADYVLFGPVFDTPGKGNATGLSELGRVSRELKGFPVFALGGVDATNFEETLEAGAAGIAAIRSLHDAESRRRICRRIRNDQGGVR
jgi:thiamine-phosphate pyrophosphorylase